jgi:hypothetical protein
MWGTCQLVGEPSQEGCYGISQYGQMRLNSAQPAIFVLLYHHHSTTG